MNKIIMIFTIVALIFKICAMSSCKKEKVDKPLGTPLAPKNSYHLTFYTSYPDSTNAWVNNIKVGILDTTKVFDGDSIKIENLCMGSNNIRVYMNYQLMVVMDQ